MISKYGKKSEFDFYLAPFQSYYLLKNRHISFLKYFQPYFGRRVEAFQPVFRRPWGHFGLLSVNQSICFMLGSEENIRKGPGTMKTIPEMRKGI